MTAYIVSCVVAGFLVGLTGIIPTVGLDRAILVLLLVLVFGVGLDVGARGHGWDTIRALGPRLLAVPVASALGSMLAIAMVAGFAWGYPWREAFAFGSAFGWYTLSGPLMTHFAGAEAGALAFLSDVIRELTAVVCIPLVARFIGQAEAVALGGATTMDTTFPILAEATDGRATPLAFAHGMILALLAPLLIPLWFSL